MTRSLCTLWLSVLLLGVACSDDPANSSGPVDGAVVDVGDDSVLDGAALDSSDTETSADAEDATDEPDTGLDDPTADITPDIDSDGGRPVVPPSSLGGDRPADVRVPDEYASRDDWPLIIVLHGYSASGLLQDAYFGLSLRRSRLGFVLVIPDGTRDFAGNRFWNVFVDAGVDDVAYLTNLIDEAVTELRVDPDRVYLIGHSNGAFMAQRLACDVADRVTAAASLAGGAFVDPDECQPTEPVSFLHVHGTLDTTVFYDGGTVLNIDYTGARDTVGQWRDHNGCTETATTDADRNYDITVIGDETTPETWSDCAANALVGLWTMTGSGHIPSVNNDFRDDIVVWLLARERASE